MLFQSKSFKAQTIFVITLVFTILCLVGITSLFFDTENHTRIMKAHGAIFLARLIIIVCVFGYTARHVLSWIDHSVSKKYNVKRLVIEFLVIILFSIILAFLAYHLYPAINEETSGHAIHPIARISLLHILVGSIVFSIYEVWMNIEKNNALQISLAHLEKEQLGLKLSAIQQKLNPHFMFNSLNVLSELVHEDSHKADIFINQFSKVYRYVLELNNETYVPISQELEFMKSYQYLLQIRLGKSLIIENNLDKTVSSKLIPPLSLQLLLENAIKHNKASNDRPLRIELTNSDSELIIINNLQERNDQKNSIGLGLQKLKETYSLTGNILPKFYKSKTHFHAELPLIHNL